MRKREHPNSLTFSLSLARCLCRPLSASIIYISTYSVSRPQFVVVGYADCDCLSLFLIDLSSLLMDDTSDRTGFTGAQ